MTSFGEDLIAAMKEALAPAEGRSVVNDAKAQPPMRLLFVCSQNRLRSPTAEAICQGIAGIEAISAGINNDAEQPLTGDLIEWADIVIAMERAHSNRINAKFRSQMMGKPLFVLGIPDDYDYIQPELVELLKVRLQRWIA